MKSITVTLAMLVVSLWLAACQQTPKEKESRDKITKEMNDWVNKCRATPQDKACVEWNGMYFGGKD